MTRQGFDHCATGTGPLISALNLAIIFTPVPLAGFKPLTLGLRVKCSTTVLQRAQPTLLVVSKLARLFYQNILIKILKTALAYRGLETFMTNVFSALSSFRVVGEFCHSPSTLTSVILAGGEFSSLETKRS